MPTGYIFDVEFCWGFQACIAGLSKTSPSFYYPPPTTVLGAIAETLAKEYKIGEDKGRELIPKLSEELLALGVRPLNCTPMRYEDINRRIAVKVTGGKLYPDPKDLKGSFDSPASGKTILSTLDENAPKLRFFAVFNDCEVSFRNLKVRLNENAFWKIHRIGTKESIVSVSEVKKIEKLSVVNGPVKTNYSFPKLDGIKPIKKLQDRWEYENYVNPFRIKKYNPIDYHLKEGEIVTYYIPIMSSSLFSRTPEYYVALEKYICYIYSDERIIGRWSK